MKKRVLICDDEPFIIESLRYIVEKEGYEVMAAKDGEEALAVIQIEKPDLIIIDAMMPNKTGYEVCQALRNDPALSHIYVVMLTAAGQKSDEIRAKLSGATEYMTKPFSPRSIKQKLHEILDK